MTRRAQGRVCAGLAAWTFARTTTWSSNIMQIVVPRGSGDFRWLKMRVALWPEECESDHLSGMIDAIARAHYIRLAVAVADGAPLGFVEASKRTDYVNGTSSSPVAFIEGLYVEPQARRRGIARALVESVASWARSERCTELASDTLLNNTVARDLHRALGFEETERVVYFRRGIE